MDAGLPATGIGRTKGMGSTQAAPAPTGSTSRECHKTATSDHCALPTERAKAGPLRYFSPIFKGRCWGKATTPRNAPSQAVHTHSFPPLRWATYPSIHPSAVCVWHSHRSDCVRLIYSTKEALSAALLPFLGSLA